MQNEEFEWWDEKAASNWRAHGVTFDQAAKALRDPFAIEDVDTDRGERIRIISARRAERHEQDTYYRANAS